MPRRAMHELYSGPTRSSGFTAKMVAEDALDAFPRSLVPEARRRRVYWNGVLARAEEGSSYRPARKLWRRERVSNYIPSDVQVRVAGNTSAEDRYMPLRELLLLPWLDPLDNANPLA